MMSDYIWKPLGLEPVPSDVLLVYMAGKVSGMKHRLIKAYAEQRKHSAHPIAAVQFACSDGGNHSEHDFGVSCWSFDECRENGALSILVRENAIRELYRADLLCAYLDVPTSFGSIAEIAFMSGIGKASYVFVKQDPDIIRGEAGGAEDAMFDAYYFVSCFPGVTCQPVTGLEDAFRMLLSLFYARLEHKLLMGRCRAEHAATQRKATEIEAAIAGRTRNK